jgi:CrcB protein
MKFEPALAFWVFMGGGAGSVLRYSVMCACARLSSSFPLATLVANVVGCLAIGLLGVKLTSGDDPATVRLRFAILVGVLGGFTTFSSFAFETQRLFSESLWQRGLLNIAANNFLGLGAVAVGIWLAKQF